jgi:PAS domain S-box-containing protein
VKNPSHTAKAVAQKTEEQIKAEVAERHSSEALFRGLLEAAPDAMVVVNQGGEIVLLNVQVEKQFGYRRDELLGQQVKNIIPEGFAERLIADDLRSAADALAQQIGTGIELSGRRKPFKINNLEFNIRSAKPALPLHSKTGISETRSILIVDDEEFIRFALSEYFSVLGYQVDVAGEWEEAEALLSARRYRLVISDLRLTGFGGTEGLEIVRSIHQRWPDTRVMLLTGYGSSEVRAEAVRRGVDAFLEKPMALPEIAKIADSMLAQTA